MKKIKSISIKTIAIFLCITILNSCSNQDNSGASKEDLIANLSKFNNEYKIVYANKGCEGFWDCLGTVAMVAGADIAGAAGGVGAVSQAATALNIATGGTGGTILIVGAGVVCGAGASYAVGTSSTTTTTINVNHISHSRYGNMEIILPKEYNYLVNVGIDHNTVIHNNFFNNQSLDDTYYKNFNAEQIKVLKSSFMNDAKNKINDASKVYAQNNFDFKTLTQTMVDNKLYTQNIKDVMDLFFFKYKSCSNFSEMKDVINYYIAQVSNSSLTTPEKQALLSGFMVASQSPYYFLND